MRRTKRFLWRFIRRHPWFSASIALCAAVLLADAAVYEPRHPVITRYEVAVPGLPRELDGFRVVQLGDIHRRLIVPDVTIRRAVALANTTRPDVAVLTGDYVGRRPDGAEPCFRMLGAIRARYGTYAVLGNHDHWAGAKPVTESLRRHGGILLNNGSACPVEGLYIVGVDDEWVGKPNAQRALRGVPAGACTVLVAHSPRSISRFKGRSGILLTGHTHGGQVQVPFIPRNRLPGLLGWKYIEGWYASGGILMYVNRGIGMVNPPLRFRCRPEVTLFVLHPTSAAKPRVISAA